MKTVLGRVIILVNDYDDAFAFYQKTFMCEKLFDVTISENQRFLHIKFTTHNLAGIWLPKAESTQEKELVGKQAGAQPLLVIYTDNCEKLYQHVIENRVTILEEIQKEAFTSTVLIFMKTESQLLSYPIYRIKILRKAYFVKRPDSTESGFSRY